MNVIGLTGGIGSGKSAVARMLRAAGIAVIDADVLAREVVAPGTPGLAAIVEAFGDAYLTAEGALDRPKLGALVFADDDARRRLNGIVHPLVAAAFMERVSALEDAGATSVVYEVPLLFENGLQGFMSGTVLVAASRETQLARIQARDGLSSEEAAARIDSQMSLEDKRALASHTIDNDGSLEATAAQLRDAWRALTGDDVAFTPA